MLEGGLTNISFSQKAEAAVSVKGYYRKNGTYVQPHMAQIQMVILIIIGVIQAIQIPTQEKLPQVIQVHI
jgi:hypothetical protein